MQRPCAPKARRPTFGPLCIRPTILPFLCSCPFLVSIFTVGLCVLWVLCGPSKATARCYTSICDGIIMSNIVNGFHSSKNYLPRPFTFRWSKDSKWSIWVRRRWAVWKVKNFNPAFLFWFLIWKVKNFNLVFLILIFDSKS